MNVGVQRVVIRGGGDARAGERIAERLPGVLQRLAATREPQSARDVERLVRDAMREVRR